MKPATELPWAKSEFDEFGGYDCMTGAIRIGPADIDAARYGQKWSAEITPSQLSAIEADAAYLCHACNAYPKLVEALKLFAACHESRVAVDLLRELGEEA